MLHGPDLSLCFPPCLCTATTSVADWRDYVSRTGLASLIPEGKIDAFIAAWNAIAGQQLGATLAFLPPANNIGIFTVDVPVKEGAHAHHSL